MSGKRYPEEFKIEAVKQVTKKGYSVAEVATRLGTTTHSLYAWIERYDQGQSKATKDKDSSVELARLKNGRFIDISPIIILINTRLIPLAYYFSVFCGDP